LEDEDLLPTEFSGHQNGDGVCISIDGSTWYTIVDAFDLDVGWYGETFLVDLDDKVAKIQSEFDPSFDYTSNL
jgi:hypothetical protein